jgi:hypothetical protein
MIWQPSTPGAKLSGQSWPNSISGRRKPNWLHATLAAPLTAALDKVRIPAMDKTDAKAIAAAIAQHGGKFVATILPPCQPPN